MKIRVHPAFLLYLLCIGYLLSWISCLCTLAALLFHEAGHYAASCIAGEQISELHLTPFGGVMYYAAAKSPRKGLTGLCVALAGPLVNYLLLISVSLRAVQSLLGHTVAQAFFSANLSMLLLNLFPVLPLDGGRMLFCAGYYWLPIHTLATLLSVLGQCAGGLLVIFALYGIWAYERLNCSLVLVGIYLFCFAFKSRKTVLSENLYVLIHDRLTQTHPIQPLRFCRVENNVQLHKLLEYILDANSRGLYEFVFVDENNFECHLGERSLCLSFLEDPSCTILQSYHRNCFTAEKRS